MGSLVGAYLLQHIVSMQSFVHGAELGSRPLCLVNLKGLGFRGSVESSKESLMDADPFFPSSALFTTNPHPTENQWYLFYAFAHERHL